MRIAKFTLSFLITLVLIYVLDNRWTIKNSPVPPLGKLLDPFHGFWQNIESNDSLDTEPVEIPGLREPVSIVLDSLMIPHIFAANDEDLYFAQGYMHAMHRLWQMEVQTHAAAGRVSEIIGAAGLDNDRYMRRLGMVYGAQKALDAMMADPVTRMIITKYTEGVNAYIASLSFKDLPFEYKLLNYEPEPWTPMKCALFLKNMENKLCMRDEDMQKTNALKLYGLDIVDLLYPDQEPVGDPIVENPGAWNFKMALPDSLPLALPDELITVKKKPGAPPGTGSNNWAVHGSKTANGAPILCNDPHLTLSLPSLWYAVQLHSPTGNTMGASLPGSPCVIIGHNDSVAWGITNAQRDLVDWYRIKFQDSKKDKYLLDGKWLETKKVVEAFYVRDQPVYYDTIVYTQWGPVTYDETFHGDNNLKHYAFRWIAHEPSNQVLALYKLNRAKNIGEYHEALNYFSSPAQNFAFASVKGDIAMRIQGKFPMRRKNEGRFVLDGTRSAMGWKEFIPQEQNVMYKNPERGFVSSANQYPVDNTYPFYITASNYEAYRNRRINQVLGASDSITVQDMMNLQNDNYNLKAAESLPLFLSMLDSSRFTPEEQHVFHQLKSWNYVNAKESQGASYYEEWWTTLMPMIWDELDRKEILLEKPSEFITIKLIREKPDLSFFDIKSTIPVETAKDVVQKSFVLSVKAMQEWQKGAVANEEADAHKAPELAWGRYKDSRINHLLRLQPLSYQVYAGGNNGTVNAHAKTHGPSWKMIVSLEKAGVKTWAIYPGGQSGNPGSKFYGNMVHPWVDGKYYPMLFLTDARDAQSAPVLKLVPQP